MKRTLGTIIAYALIPLGVYAQPVVINEINYNADGDFDAGEWIETVQPRRQQRQPVQLGPEGPE